MKATIRALSAMVVLIVFACSGPVSQPSPTQLLPASTEPPGTTTTTIETGVAIARYEDCLSDQGLEIESIPLDAKGRPRLELVLRDVDFADQASAAAMSACAEHLSTGALDLANEPELQAAMSSVLEEFSRCLRDHGVSEFPDPTPGFIGVGGAYPLDEIPYSDPDLETAVEACRERLG